MLKGMRGVCANAFCDYNDRCWCNSAAWRSDRVATGGSDCGVSGKCTGTRARSGLSWEYCDRADRFGDWSDSCERFRCGSAVSFLWDHFCLVYRGGDIAGGAEIVYEWKVEFLQVF